jgi:hypothetical protein
MRRALRRTSTDFSEWGVLHKEDSIKLVINENAQASPKPQVHELKPSI